MHLLSQTRVAILIVLRSRLPWLSGFFLLALCLIAYLAAQFSGRQPATVALDIGLSFIRLALPIATIVITQQLLSAEFERRYIYNSITYPSSRRTLLFGRLTAGFIITLSLLLILSTALALIVWLISGSYPQGTPVALGPPYIIVVAFIGLDLLLINTAAALLATIASSPSIVLVGTLGFVFAARSFSAIVELLTLDSGIVSNAESYRFNLSLLKYILPDLGALDIRAIALYGGLRDLPLDWHWSVLSALTYIIALIALSDRALQCKRFN